MIETTTVYRDLGIDSGQLMIIDPCYAGKWKDGDVRLDESNPSNPRITSLPATNDYERACQATDGEAGCGPVDCYGGAFAFGNFGGDVPVSITVVREGSRVVRVIIDCQPQEDEQDEEDGEEEDERLSNDLKEMNAEDLSDEDDD